MEINKLRPMVEFVNRINELIPKEIDEFFDSWILKKLRAIEKKAKLLSQPLTLGMLVPCDEEGEPIEKPNNLTFELANDGHLASTWVVEEWNRAKERVMFEGFELEKEYDNGYYLKIYDTSIFIHKESKRRVETLIWLDLTLTPNALKEIYGS